MRNGSSCESSRLFPVLARRLWGAGGRLLGQNPDLGGNPGRSPGNAALHHRGKREWHCCLQRLRRDGSGGCVHSGSSPGPSPSASSSKTHVFYLQTKIIVIHKCLKEFAWFVHVWLVCVPGCSPQRCSCSRCPRSPRSTQKGSRVCQPPRQEARCWERNRPGTGQR